MLDLLLTLSAMAWDPADSLQLPTPKTCVLPDTSTPMGDEDLLDSGLSASEVSSALDDFSPMVQRCVPTTSAPRGSVELDLVVACTGQVEEVVVITSQDLGTDLVSCVAETLRYAPFPAHGLEEGQVVTWPLRFDYAR